jgi:hypothetical protein
MVICNGQDLTRQPLHQGIRSSEAKGSRKSPHRRSMPLFSSYRSFLEVFGKLRFWQNNERKDPDHIFLWLDNIPFLVAM